MTEYYIVVRKPNGREEFFSYSCATEEQARIYALDKARLCGGLVVSWRTQEDISE